MRHKKKRDSDLLITNRYVLNNIDPRSLSEVTIVSRASAHSWIIISGSVHVAASMYAIDIPGKHPCMPKSHVNNFGHLTRTLW